MAYATVDDVAARSRKTMTEAEQAICECLLDDAALIIDAYNAAASSDAKKLVSCNMIIRAIGSGTDESIPIGASQGTASALGYSQSWTMGSGSTGELYLTKLDKKVLGVGSHIAFANPLEVEE